MNKKIKVGIFTSGFVPVTKESTKGTEVFTYDLCEGLISAGVEVHLFGAHGSAGNFAVVNPRHSKEVTQNISSMYENNVYQILNFFDFLNYCKENQIDIIHDQTSELTIGLARCSDIPVVATLHGVREPSNLSEYYKLNNDISFVSPSNFAKAASPDLKVEQVINHGIDLAKYEFNPKGNGRFLWVGRIVEDKGLLDAMKAVQKADAELDIVGYSPPEMKENQYFDQVMDLVKSDKRFNLIGRVGHDKISSYMSAASALIMPTRCKECFGLVLIEAMAGGTPVVAYDNGAINEIIDNGQNGYYVPDGSCEDLSVAIKKIDQIDRKECRETVENKFSRELMVKRYILLYEELINKNEDHRNKN